ncbi:MAG: TIGR01244 family phosphatase [Rhodospirillales bacterium]|nr:TIGR01244 family phosphatase [Rhodospirillales bacterium]
MNSRALSPEYSVAPQLQPAQLALAAQQGFRAILCARPDNEEPGQPSAATIEEAAKAAGLDFVHIPISSPHVDAAAAQRIASTLASLPRPILGYCRTGIRAEALWNAA